MRSAATKQFGLRVRKLRLDQGITQETLADRANLHTTYISGIETGKRNPSLTAIIAIARGLGVSMSELFDGKMFLDAEDQ